MSTAIQQPYLAATRKLLGEGFVFDARTCFYERGAERLKLRWNGKVYARRRGPPKPEIADAARADPPAEIIAAASPA